MATTPRASGSLITTRLWDSICDHRVTGDVREERCYLRYVEVFSRPPKFAAQFAFVTPEPRVEFGMEPGTRYAEAGFRILTGADVAWAAPQAGCLVGLACIFEEGAAETRVPIARPSCRPQSGIAPTCFAP